MKEFEIADTLALPTQDALSDYRLPSSPAALTDLKFKTNADAIPSQFPLDDFLTGDEEHDETYPRLDDKQKKQIDAAVDVIKRTAGDPSKEAGGMKIVAEALKDAYAKSERTAKVVAEEINAKLKKDGMSIQVTALQNDYVLVVFENNQKPTGSALHFKRKHID
ncbi:MAG: hypothetical protein K2X93_10645 [Candidatus Obscuribacterales bacterium]|nr:hypothetical protein [Candidatus Obscuribacterales bacterium]